MPTPVNTCKDCRYIEGNECYLYTGRPVTDCGLVSGSWYKIEDLIAALECAGSLSTTTTMPAGNSHCICLLVEGENAATGLSNASSLFRYALYKDSARTIPIVERSLDYGQRNMYVHYGELDSPGPLYLSASAELIVDVPGSYYSTGGEVDLVITANDLLIYARSIAVPQEGINLFADLPPIPKGKIKIILYGNGFDTNANQGQGLVAFGGSRLTNSSFICETTLNDGGRVETPRLYWPVTAMPEKEYATTGFDTEYYQSHATSMTIKISGVNNEQVPLEVEFAASGDAALNFKDTVAVAATYERTVPITLQQAEDNDFLIRILKQ